MTHASIAPDPALDHFLVARQLAAPGEPARWEPLTGGVSSDIWRVDVGGRTFCVKRALAQLKVAADWKAPLSRNTFEWAWIQFAARHCPDHVPAPLTHDEAAGLFAMSFLEPAQHPVWKQQLLRGEVNAATAAAVGDVLGRLHAASAGRAEVARAFDTIDNFYALRLEPYLVATANRHPALVCCQRCCWHGWTASHRPSTSLRKPRARSCAAWPARCCTIRCRSSTSSRASGPGVCATRWADAGARPSASSTAQQAVRHR